MWVIDKPKIYSIGENKDEVDILRLNSNFDLQTKIFLILHLFRK